MVVRVDVDLDADQIGNKIRDFFTFKTRRQKLSTRHEIVVDPGSFLIGAFGAVAVGLIADESQELQHINSSPNRELFLNSALRIVTYPFKSAVRFLAGGCIYVVLDTCIIRLLGYRAPFLAGAATGLLFASGARSSIFLGSVLGMALFAQIADMMFDSLLQSRT